ncbi:MAG TPA: hypothetical protein VN738_05760 [Acidothermaceae bacterium]|nr:hypothetical protein [Acidothermaceae bacterium]
MTNGPIGAPARQPSLGAGVVAGLGAGVVGAFVWGAIGDMTNTNWSIVAIGVGVLVALAATKAAHTGGTELGVAAAIITLLACLVGDVGATYARAAHDVGISIRQAMDVVPPTTVLKDNIHHQPLSMLFILLGAFYAFRYAATNGNLRRRSVAAGPAYGQQPSYASPQAPMQPQAAPQLPTQPQPGAPDAQPEPQPPVESA